MLKYFKAFAMLAIIALGVLTVSCQKNDLTQTEKVETSTLNGITDSLNNNHENLTRTIYISEPGVGGSTSPGAINLYGSCGYYYYGGNIKAQVLSQNGSYFTIRIRKSNNTAFDQSGTAYVKVCSVCGTPAGQQSYNFGDYYVDVTVQATFPRGYVHFYPVTVNVYENYRSYAEPILIRTDPLYDENWVYNSLLGTANGVDVRCNGTNTNHSLSLSNQHQCVEFCKNYYSSVYNKNTGGGDAGTWFNNAVNKGLVAYNNEGSVPPRVGDILCTGSGSGFGHIAIIMDVGPNYVKVAHQNSGIPGNDWQRPIGGIFPYNPTTNKVTHPAGYGVQGWLRMPN